MINNGYCQEKKITTKPTLCNFLCYISEDLQQKKVNEVGLFRLWCQQRLLSLQISQPFTEGCLLSPAAQRPLQILTCKRRRFMLWTVNRWRLWGARGRVTVQVNSAATWQTHKVSTRNGFDFFSLNFVKKKARYSVVFMFLFFTLSFLVLQLKRASENCCARARDACEHPRSQANFEELMQPNETAV